ncbi:MAG TPA: hypothetical protein VLL57_02065, partial [Candidatus Binataceae bacterium]|nr:hypothetical protein [Candidatus Binataceae bacterium]
MNLLLKAAGPSPGRKLYLARQTMNAIFLATLAVGFLLLRELIGDMYIAATAALLTFSGSQFMFYRTMIHFDQPALLGLLLLLYAVLRRQKCGSLTALYLWALFAVSFGRGYVSLLFLGFWAAIDYGISLWSEWPNPLTAVALWVKQDAVRVLALAAAVTACYLVYNVATEARVRGVSFFETSIVDSAGRRLGFVPSRDPAASEWRRYLPATAGRLVRLATPYPVFKVMSENVDVTRLHAALPLAAAVVFLAAVLISHLSALPPGDRAFYLLLMASGLPWFIGMRRHAASFNYTTIYFAGLVLVFYAAVCARIPKKLRGVGLAVSVAVFVASAAAVNVDRSALTAGEPYTADFARVVERLRPDDRVYIPGDYRELLYFRPYALGFYLSRQAIAPAGRADYALSDDRRFAPGNLTPENTAVFLFPAP